ncbi:MAG: helix-turn-helix domain containing protein [Lachnospiraceae bacterium]|nr:helix-turn-helix domain containing protein [Lachnospiraceae bacterium]DAS46205.1 MAG TPA: Myb2 [Caudoviricetes sp.]
MKEENDYKTRRGWTLEEIATLSELKANGTKIVKIAERLNRNASSIAKKIEDMGADLYDEETWKNYVSQGLPWTKEELRIVKEIMKNGGGCKESALRVPHSPGSIQTKIFRMGKDFYDEGTWDKYAID